MRSKILILLCLLSLSTLAQAKPKVILININGAIGPATKDYIFDGIDYAAKENANALVIQLNTPGGLMESTREIVSRILSSKVPVIVYVAPGGSRAGSAGVFITMAANIAAMAPGTNIGAAHPVTMQGGQSDSIMSGKVTNDASAFIRSIAHKRQRNAVWADQAVRHSISATENEALQENVINLISPSLQALLNAIDGTIVETAKGQTRIETANADIKRLEMSWREELLAIISDPNISYILLMIGIYGILFELFNPGAVVPGIVGGISIILATYSFQFLPINYAGLSLIILAVILFLLEIKITSHGALTIGGVIAMFIGSIMLFDQTPEFMRTSMSLIITFVIATVVFFGFIITLGLRAQKRKPVGGSEGLVGETGIAFDDFNKEGTGTVRLHGELWNAVSNHDIKKGDKVKVESVKSLTIKVKPL